MTQKRCLDLTLINLILFSIAHNIYLQCISKKLKVIGIHRSTPSMPDSSKIDNVHAKPPLNPLFFITAIKPTICSKFSRAFGTHQDPFYQWWHLMLFTASFLMRLQKNYCSINWGEVVALIAVHFWLWMFMNLQEGSIFAFNYSITLDTHQSF